MKSSSVFLLFIALCVLIALALATETRAGPTLTPRQIFNQIDSNLNGQVTKEEAKTYLTKLGAPSQMLTQIINEIWSKEDANKDGVITYAEWALVNVPIINEHNNNNNNNNNNAARATTTTTTNTVNTMSFDINNGITTPNHHFAEVFTRFVNASAAYDEDLDDELLDGDDEDDSDFEYFWLNFSEDPIFCPENANGDGDEDNCWFKVYEHVNADGEHEYWYACVEDDETDETTCYSVKIEERDDGDE